MRLAAMLRVRMAWASHEGPRRDVVVSSRIRLARNLAGHPFPPRASPKALAASLAAALPVARKARWLGKPAWVPLGEVDEIDRAFLVERRLISALLARDPRHRGVVVGERELLSVMLNEEDHLRLQGVDSGLCLEGLLEEVLSLDDELASGLAYAFDRRLGHLTTCPTNAGTGLRASALVHLPALALTGRLPALLEGLSRLRMTARGLYGEGTQVLGDFYQVSNASTLGASEETLARSVTKAVGTLAAKELEARQSLAGPQRRTPTEDLVWRAVGALANARTLPYPEAMRHLSLARMALALGWKVPSSLPEVDELMLLAQPAHVQMLAGKALAEGERDFLRAELLRRKFKA